MERYTKVKRIGEGSFGKAYLVRAKDSNKQFVIKEINISRMNGRERDEARKEVAVLAQLKHPNIVSYKESFEESGNLYIAMDYCDAGDLFGYISMQRSVLMPEERVLDMFVQICLSVKHIHDRKILHRDIKSQNIFMTKGGIMKLGDFGISKVLNSTMELARTCIGTPYYLSPEICENRPYNNKSDIWSLGCVLYEMTTLKHAFDAGNMKNLVVKIMRGTYPPVSPKYSYELRNLIAQMFKRDAKERPSANAILKKSFIQQRIKKFLSEAEVGSEFSHTILHGQRLQKRLSGGAEHVPSSAPAAKKPALALLAADVRADPSSAYPRPLPKRPVSSNAPRKPLAVVKRPPSAGGRPPSAGVRPPSAAGAGRPPRGGAAAGAAANNQQDMAARRQELVERERRRQEEAVRRRREEAIAQYAQQHQQLVERQKADRIRRSGEAVRQSLIDSFGSDERVAEAVKQDDMSSPRELRHVPAVERKPLPPLPLLAAPGNERGDYSKYHEFLDQRKVQRDAVADVPPAAEQPRRMPKAAVKSALEDWAGREAVKLALVGGSPAMPAGAALPPAPGRAAAAIAMEHRAQGAAASDRARIVEEFKQRQRDAALNRARGLAVVAGGQPCYPAGDVQRHAVAAAGIVDALAVAGSVAAAVGGGQNGCHSVQEEEYLSRLSRIRQQNLNDRHDRQGNGEGRAVAAALGDPRFDAEARRRKIEALKMQAEDRAQRLSEELEKKKREVLENDQRRWPVPAAAIPNRPVVPERRAVMGGGGGGGIREAELAAACAASAASNMPSAPSVTSVLMQIGAAPSANGEREKSDLKKKRDDILRKLNEKEKAQPSSGQPPSSSADERPRWGVGKVNLSQLQLEATASQMEATGDQDAAVRVANQPASARPQWGKPSATVVSAMQAKVVDEGATSAAGFSAAARVPAAVTGVAGSGQTPRPAVRTKPVGVTITLSKPAAVVPAVSAAASTAAAVAGAPAGARSERAQWCAKQDVRDSDVTDSSLAIEKPAVGDVPADSPADEIEIKPTQSPQPRPTASAAWSEKLATSSVFPGEDKSSTSTEKLVSVAVPSEAKDSKRLFERVIGMPAAKRVSAADGLVMQDIEDNEGSDCGGSCSEVPAPLQGSADVIIGLTTGSFDVKRVSLLRTCSLPDMTKISLTSAEDVGSLSLRPNVSASVRNVRKDSEDSELAVASDEAVSSDKEKLVEVCEDVERASGQLGDDKREEADNASGGTDDEDLEAYRAKLEITFAEEEDSGEAEGGGSGENEGYGDDEDEEGADDVGQDNAGEDSSDAAVVEAEEDELDLQDEADYMTIVATLAQLVKDGNLEDSTSSNSAVSAASSKDVMTGALKGAGDSPLPSSVEDDLQSTVTRQQEESWQSDSSSGTEEGDDGLFSNLEQRRAELEAELGLSVFMQAYKVVQAVYEDEDDSMENCGRVVGRILGKEKMHLHDKLLKLVVADSVYNDG